MEHLFDEAQACLDAAIYVPGLLAILLIPDAAGAVDSLVTGNGNRYRKWFDENVDQKMAGMDGELAWAARNALMHETSMRWDKLGYSRLVIQITGQDQVFFHNFGVVEFPSEKNPHGYHAAVVNLQALASAVIGGAKTWLNFAQQDPDKVKRLDGLLQLRRDGIGPLKGNTLNIS